MRLAVLVGVLGVFCTTVVAAPVDYSLKLDRSQSSLGIYIGIYAAPPSNPDPNDPDPNWLVETYDSANVGGTLDLRVDEVAMTAEMLDFNASLIDDLTLFLNLTVDPNEPITIQIDSPYEGVDPIALDMTGSDGAASYDGSGNISFPNVQAGVTGGGYYTGTPGGLSIPALLGGFLGVVDDTPGTDQITGIVDLAGLDIALSDDIPAIIVPGGNPSGSPKLTIPLDVSGGDEVFTGLWVLYGVSGQFVAVPEPVSLSLLALGGISLLYRRRR